MDFFFFPLLLLSPKTDSLSLGRMQINLILKQHFEGKEQGKKKNHPKKTKTRKVETHMMEILQIECRH